VQTTLEAAVREFLLGSGFVGIHTPKGDRDCAGAESPQAYLQLAMAAGFDRVFEVGSTLPAAPATPAAPSEVDGAGADQQPAELTRLDLEVSWIDGPDELLTLLAGLLRRALFAVQETHGLDVERCFGRPVDLPEGTIPRLPLSRALELTGRAARPGGHLSAEDARALCRYAEERYGHGYLFLTGHPPTEWPFAVMRDDPGGLGEPTPRSFALLGHGLELAAGAQREHRYDRLRGQAAAAPAGSGAPDWYFEMFRHGCPPHGGLGIGLNRLLMGLLDRPSLRDTSFVSCGPGRSPR